MHFRTVASLALLACASSVAAEPKPYKLAMMPIPGMSLMRRDTSGYQPEQTVCGAGNTCSEACGGGYTECASKDQSIHCYDPTAQQDCCTDGSGNSCDAGYYCTHDTKAQTWCCPESLDLAACAAAYSVVGGLETATSTTSTTSTTSSTTTTSKATSKATSTTYTECTTTSTPSTTSSKTIFKDTTSASYPSPTPHTPVATPTYASSAAAVTSGLSPPASGGSGAAASATIATVPTKAASGAVANSINGLAILVAGIAALL